MEKLLELAEKIKDKELREKVIKFLKEPKLSNPNFKYKNLSLRDAPASNQWHHSYVGGLVEHTYAVTLMCIEVAKVLEKVYKIKIDMDSLIAAALLHDIGKLWEYKKYGGSWTSTKITLDHTILGTSELYARGFPESVIHIVASHFGHQGPTPPQTTEALILHTIDNMDALLSGSGQPQLLYLI